MGHTPSPEPTPDPGQRTSAERGPAIVQGRTIGIVLAVVLLALAVALAVALGGDTGGPAVLPTATPSPTSSPSAAGSGSTGTPPATPSGTATATRTGVPVPTATAGGGQTPRPTVVVPPVPTTPVPAPSPLPPPPAFPAALRGLDLEVVPGAGRVVALTFDAGANSAGLPKILSTLSGKGVRGTFFLTGTWAGANPGGVAQIVAGGHRTANHSMTHPGFTSLTGARIREEVLGAERAIRAAGADPRPLFRFPFGERDARTIAAVNDLGYASVRWTVDTLGWKGTSGGLTAQAVADRVLAGLQPGEIVLMHIGSNPDDGSTLDADALAQIIDRIRAAGYGFVTLDALLG
ncbi:polysaccharide deacetylase family protein [Sinomonas halotolerans]|uniref:Polysaccharide deacetylase family protein n=1 Tax=Sinomonas halotolerans TaxID=1644133 RepID=A0ABU9X1S7_9MICC